MNLNLRRILILLATAFISTTATAENHDGLIEYKQCLPCHGADAGGNANLKAPSIAGLPAWYIERQLLDYQKGIRGKHPDDIPGMRMRAMSKTVQSQRVKPVAEYIAAMPAVALNTTVKGNVDVGQQLFAVCSACHGEKAEGNEALNAPPLKIMNDWYQVTQLNNYKTGARGYHPEDIHGATMKGMASTLVDDQAVLDVVSYINTLK